MSENDSPKPPRIKNDKNDVQMPQSNIPPIYTAPPQELTQDELARYLAEKYNVAYPIAKALVDKLHLDTKVMKLTKIEELFKKVLSLSDAVRNIGPVTRSTVDTSIAKMIAEEMGGGGTKSNINWDLLREIMSWRMTIELAKSLTTDNNENNKTNEILNGIKEALMNVSNAINTITQKINEHEMRFNILEEKIETKSKTDEMPEINALKEAIDNLNKKIEEIKEENTRNAFSEMFNKLSDEIKSLKEELNNIKNIKTTSSPPSSGEVNIVEKIKEIKNTYEQLEKEFGGSRVEKIPSDIKNELTNLKATIDMLEKKLEEAKNKSNISDTVKYLVENHDKIFGMIREVLGMLSSLKGVSHPSHTGGEIAEKTANIPKPPKLGE